MSNLLARISWALAILLIWGILAVPSHLAGGEPEAQAVPPAAKDPTMDWIAIISNLGLPIALVLWFLRKDRSREEETTARTKTLEEQVRGMQQKQLDMAESRQKDTAKTVERVTEALEQNSHTLTAVGRTLRGMLDILQSHRCMVSGRNPGDESRTNIPTIRPETVPPYQRIRTAQDIPTPPGDDSDQNVHSDPDKPRSGSGSHKGKR